jgi:hypothetical protein
MDTSSNIKEAAHHLGRVYLYPVGIALYLSSFLGLIALTLFMAFSATSSNYTQLVAVILNYVVPLTLAGVLIGYFVGVYVGSKASLLVAILVFIYFIYFVGSNNSASSPYPNTQNIELIIIWFFITILIGRGIYNTQAGPIRSRFRKTHTKKDKFRSSYFRSQVSAYSNPTKYNKKLYGSSLFAIAFLILFLALVVSMLLEDLTIYLSVVSAFFIYAYVQRNSLTDITLFPLSGLLLLMVFLILGLRVAPLFAGSLLILYLNGEIITMTIIGILVILLLFAYLNFKDLSLYKALNTIKPEKEPKAPGYKLKMKERKSIYKRFIRTNKEMRVFIAVLFPIVVTLLIFSSIEFGQSLPQPNLSTQGLSGIGSVEIYNPYGGYMFYEPHGAHLTVVLRFNISNNLNNYRQEASILNISVSNSESHLLEVVSYSPSTLPIGITYVKVTVDVTGSYFSGLVDLSVDVS